MTNELAQIGQQLPSAYQQHWAAISIGSATLVHLMHTYGPQILVAWNYIRENGGIVGIVKAFFCGTAKPQPTEPPKQP